MSADVDPLRAAGMAQMEEAIASRAGVATAPAPSEPGGNGAT